ncbi:helix-turn-helix domain-containing protein [Marinobacterium aestuariivivens]|uniref:Helix-turn-helix domain-containing protein n=1 Tax=Marinobacterium aestuariivivens TaxID=1698799 RepID=A0ABW2A441_9GAMM
MDPRGAAAGGDERYPHLKRQRDPAEIAYRWGFADQAQFCRAFKARFGCTAREARAAARRAPD